MPGGTAGGGKKGSNVQFTAPSTPAFLLRMGYKGKEEQQKEQVAQKQEYVVSDHTEHFNLFHDIENATVVEGQHLVAEVLAMQSGGTKRTREELENGSTEDEAAAVAAAPVDPQLVAARGNLGSRLSSQTEQHNDNGESSSSADVSNMPKPVFVAKKQRVEDSSSSSSSSSSTGSMDKKKKKKKKKKDKSALSFGLDDME